MLRAGRQAHRASLLVVQAYHCSATCGLADAATRVAEELDAARQDTFRYADLTITTTTNPKPKPALEDLRFGQTFTDHMLVVQHLAGSGWSAPAVAPFGPLPLHPAAQVLHYGLSCFEGMKAYCGADGRGRLFRPALNMARLQRSARRLLLADFDATEALKCIQALLRADRSWLPDAPGYSLYVRPFLASTGSSLGVHCPSETLFNVILSPVGPYFRSGLRPVTLFLDEAHVRAWPRGVGEFKIGGNYGPTLAPQDAAHRASGAAQVVYTLPCPHDPHPDAATLSESGAMNFFVLLSLPGGRRQLVTPPLDGTILPGVTRDSVLQLVRGWGEFEVAERAIRIREVKQAAAEGRLLEMFGCGTACIVQPVQALVRGDGERYEASFRVEDESSLTWRLTKELTDIQYGRVPHEWSVPFE